MQLNQSAPPKDSLLAGLPDTDYRRLMSHCELVELLHNQILNNAADKISHVYFPIGCIISLMKRTDKDKDLEVAMIGKEGMLSSMLMLGDDTATFTSVVLMAGASLRMPAQVFIKELEQYPLFQLRLKRYLSVLVNQLLQNAACTRFHVVEERLARLLLMIRDRAQSQSFHITQESLAQMLGVRRVGVTKAAGALQNKRLISYSRGDIVIQDNAGLEAASCSCYHTDNETYTRIMHA